MATPSSSFCPSTRPPGGDRQIQARQRSALPRRGGLTSGLSGSGLQVGTAGPRRDLREKKIYERSDTPSGGPIDFRLVSHRLSPDQTGAGSDTKRANSPLVSGRTHWSPHFDPENSSGSAGDDEAFFPRALRISDSCELLITGKVEGRRRGSGGLIAARSFGTRPQWASGELIAVLKQVRPRRLPLMAVRRRGPISARPFAPSRMPEPRSGGCVHD